MREHIANRAFAAKQNISLVAGINSNMTAIIRTAFGTLGVGNSRRFVFTFVFCMCSIAERIEARSCSIADSPVVRVTFDGEKNQYVVMEPPNGEDRMLSALQYKNNHSPIPEVLEISHSHKFHLRSLEENEDYFLMKKCPCGSDDERSLYCPSNKDFCIKPRNNDVARACYKSEPKTDLIRNYAPFFWFYCIILVLHFITSHQGKHARDFFRDKLCCRTRNELIIDEIVQSPERANFLLWRIQEYQRRRRRRNEESDEEALDEEQPQFSDLPVAWEVNEIDGEREQHPTMLALKTRRHVRPATAIKKNESQEGENGAVEEEEEEALNCAICFAEIETGERVGALPCEHTFHVDCLKAWLKRRNVCPLCQVPDIATPRFNWDSTSDNNTS